MRKLSLRGVCTASKWDSDKSHAGVFALKHESESLSFPFWWTEKNTYIPSKGRANGTGNSWTHCRRKAANPFAFTVARSRSLLACGESKSHYFSRKADGELWEGFYWLRQYHGHLSPTTIKGQKDIPKQDAFKEVNTVLGSEMNSWIYTSNLVPAQDPLKEWITENKWTKGAITL